MAETINKLRPEFLDCKEFDKLIDKKQELNLESLPCCLDDECCEGQECGENCCNEDGNKPMGYCGCGEENNDYTLPTKEDFEKYETAKSNIISHLETCSICSKGEK